MSGSSGIRQDSHIIDAECENVGICGWSGEVDEMFDPETYVAWWECPECGHHHDTSTYVFSDDRSEDA